MDKSWLDIRNRCHPAYEKGAEDFVKFASENRPNATEILCPCKKCRNMKFVKKDLVAEHIIVDGFLASYTCWIFHGESSSSSNPVNESVPQDGMRETIHDAFGVPFLNTHGEISSYKGNEYGDGFDEETKKFFNLVKEVEQELYPGCKKYSTLSFLVQLLNIKCLSGMSDKTFTMLLQLLKDAFPAGETLPKSFYESKKIIGNLGLDYKKIHACPNDCMLYWNETAKESECRHCHTSKYKQSKIQSDDTTKEQKIPTKVVRYFPFIPRLKRLFMSSKTASHMTWHAEGRTDDGILRHPADSLAWKKFDELYPDFANDSRNVRLGLASDGFNPFRSMSISHSSWPVILMPYNLPPWMCMKQPYMIMSLLIDGPRAPGNDIDVYLRPLIEELKELWVGVDTYDAASNHMFRMRASLMWTINDFPAYANLSGWSTKGKLACPCCHKFTHSRRLHNGYKECFMGHRRWLDKGHKFRKDKVSFDGTVELDSKPTPLSGAEAYEEIKDIKNNFGKDKNPKGKKRRRDNQEDEDEDEEQYLTYNWKKKSIFFELGYWKDNLIRHNLDVMHIEKNVCDNILWTLLNVNGKTKDNLNAGLDLKKIGIRKALHPQHRAGNKFYLPPSGFTLENKDKDALCKVLKEVKVPDGYASNISRGVNVKQRNISGLKNHDNHILIQELLPVALRNVLPKNVLQPLIELSNFFKNICSKVMHVNDFDHVQSRIALTLCHLERIFPPLFFDVMEHLVIHLAEEAKIAGPPQYRWMYPIERYLFTLKKYVRTRSHPDGSIAEGYWVDECLTFCSRYLHDTETKTNRPIRNDDGEDDSLDRIGGHPLGASVGFFLDDITYAQAHRYVLMNTPAVAPFREEHRISIRRSYPRSRPHDIDRIHNETFHLWFREHVLKLHEDGNGQISQEIMTLAMGPLKTAERFSGYIINGVRYQTKAREMNRTTQNSGVMLKANIDSYASARDMNPVAGDVNFYGVLTDIIILHYKKDFKFVLFKCDWVDNSKGLVEDDFGFRLVNFKNLLYARNQVSDEPFILASQAQQVFYIQDPVEEDWKIVVNTKPRDFFDMFGQHTGQDTTQHHMELWNEQHLDDTTFTRDEDISWVRQGVSGSIVDTTTTDTPTEREMRKGTHEDN